MSKCQKLELFGLIMSVMSCYSVLNFLIMSVMSVMSLQKSLYFNKMNRKQKDFLVKKYDNLVVDLVINNDKGVEILERFRDFLLNYLEEITD